MSNCLKHLWSIRASSKGLLEDVDLELELEDLIRLKVIERQLLDMAKKYNPNWFEPIPEEGTCCENRNIGEDYICLNCGRT